MQNPVVNVGAMCEMDMLGDQEGKKATRYTRAWYITKAMFRKT